MSFQTRHAARTQEWPALPAGRAPLPLGMAPAAERRSVRRLGSRTPIFWFARTLTAIVIALLVSHLDAFACSCGFQSIEEELERVDFVVVGTVIRIDGTSQLALEAKRALRKAGHAVREFLQRAHIPESGDDAVSDLARLLSVKFRVERSFWGASGDIIVRTGRGGGDCGYAFEVGKRYIIFGYRYEVDGREVLGTGICTHTAPADEAGELIRAVENASPKKRGA